MVNLRHIIIVYLTIILTCPAMNHCYATNTSLVLYEDSIIRVCNPVYDYEIISENGNVDCIGTFSFDVTAFRDIDVIMCLSDNHLPTDLNSKFFGLKIKYNVEKEVKTTIIQDRVRWGRYIALEYYFDGLPNKIKVCEIYSSDYISDNDKSVLFSSIDECIDTETGHIDINFNNGNLIIKTTDNLPSYYISEIRIINMSGSHVYHYSNSNGENCIHVSLNDFARGMYLVNIKTLESSIIKKIII